MRSQESGTGRGHRVRRGRALFVTLSLACLAFWAGADFLHFDDGPGSHPDCPVCHLDRISSGEPASVPMAASAVALLPLCWLALPLPAPLTEAEELTGPDPRGPPSV